MRVEQLQSEFASAFGRPAAWGVRAPGRVNLIGEHTDYNDGFVLPIAIDRATLAAGARRDDRRVTFRSRQADGEATVDLDAPVEPGEPAWANYPRGVAAGLLATGAGLAGCDILFDSDVPLGSGLSSSASLEVAAALALLAAAGGEGTPKAASLRDEGVSPSPRLQQLAAICQRAEHEFAGAPCGIMDPSVVLMAREGAALLLDCRSGETEHVPFDDPSAVVLVVDTQVRHAIGGGEYAERRRQCETAARKLGVPSLRDLGEADLARAAADGRIAGKDLMRARHVVGEIARTPRAAEALRGRDMKAFGELMAASHASLRDDYEVSCPELDAVVELAGAREGVFGARMTGGGFGGCAIVLAESARSGAIAEAIADGFEARFGRRCPVLPTRARAGAGLLGAW